MLLRMFDYTNWNLTSETSECSLIGKTICSHTFHVKLDAAVLKEIVEVGEPLPWWAVWNEQIRL